MRHKYIRILIIVIIILSMSIISGCSSDEMTIEEILEQQINTNNILLSTVIEQESEIQALTNIVEALRGDAMQTGVGSILTEAPRVINLDSHIIFGAMLEYTGAQPAPNTSRLNLSDRVSLMPSDNWQIQIEGNTTRYFHPTGISGTIQLSQIQQVVRADTIEDTILRPFMNQIPYTSAIVQRIFLEDVWRGLYATMDILDGNRPGRLTAGVIGQGNTAVVYMFYYSGSPNRVNDELISNLVRSMRFGGQMVRIE